MKIFSQIIGLLAVAAFLLSYQQKRRNNIILLNLVSRYLYIMQYVLLGAFSGAVFDTLAAFSSILAKNKEKSIFKKHFRPIVITINLFIILIGIFIAYSNKSLIDLFALAGVLFEIDALWLTKEKSIRIVSLFAAPLWFVYNFLSCAYGSAIGNILTFISIVAAMIRYKNINM